MTEDEDDDDVYREITFAEAKEERKERIKWLLQGESTKDTRRRAKLLQRCRKGDRCYRDECPVCARRKRRAARRIGSVAEAIYPRFKAAIFLVSEIDVSSVKTLGARRAVNEEKVHALAASMSQIGLRTPITVREKNKKAYLVCGLHRLEAAKRLEWERIPCFIVPGDEHETRPWEISEDVYRAELSVLDRAEHINELCALIGKKGVQVAPPGGKQPHDRGIKKAAKALGFSKDDVRRSMIISEMSAKAKEEARTLELDDNQAALLEVARLSTPEAQLKAVRRIDEEKRAARDRRAAAAVAGNEKSAAKIEKLKADIAKKIDKRDELNNRVAFQRDEVRKIEDQLVADGVNSALTEIDPSPSIVPGSGAKIQSESDTSDDEPDLDDAFAALEAAWNDAPDVRRAWDEAPTVVRERFIAEVLRGTCREPAPHS